MAVVKVLRPFRDLREHKNRKVGEEFSASTIRATEIATRLPGYVTVLAEPKASPAPKADPAPKDVDLRSMTKAELLAAAESKDLPVTAKMTKNKILELLEA